MNKHGKVPHRGDQIVSRILVRELVISNSLSQHVLVVDCEADPEYVEADHLSDDVPGYFRVFASDAEKYARKDSPQGQKTHIRHADVRRGTLYDFDCIPNFFCFSSADHCVPN